MKQTEKEEAAIHANAQGWRLKGQRWQVEMQNLLALEEVLDALQNLKATFEAFLKRNDKKGWRVSKEKLQRFEAKQAQFERQIAQEKERERQKLARLFAKNPALQFISNPQALKDAEEEDKRARNREACKRYRERKKAQTQTQAREKWKLQRATGGKVSGGKRSK